MGCCKLNAQQNMSRQSAAPVEIETDSSKVARVMPGDSIAPADSTRRKGMLEAPVAYQANDSIVMTATNMAYLYGEADVKYQQIQLQAEHIQMNMDSSLVYAKFGWREFRIPAFCGWRRPVRIKNHAI